MTETLSKRLFGYSCKQVDEYVERRRKEQSAELQELRRRIDLALEEQERLLKELSSLVEELQRAQTALARHFAPLLGLAEKLAAAEREAERAFEEALNERRRRLAELEAKRDALAQVMAAVESAAAGLDAAAEQPPEGVAGGEGVPCSEERS
ncbi:MAG: hypothetical protein ACPLTR_03060 [Thermacetogeniaceae bacterium]